MTARAASPVALAERIEQSVDTNAFLFHHLGLDYEP